MTTRKKRKHPRARARGLSVHFQGPAGPATCRVEDISLGGLFIATEQELLPGSALSLTLLKPGMKKGIPLPATVVNLRPPGEGRKAGVGVRFEGLPAEARSRLLVLLVELGVSNPVQAEAESDGAPPVAATPPPLPRGAANFQAISLKDVRARAAAYGGDGATAMPWAQEPAPKELSFEAVSGVQPQSTAVMSRAEVEKHLADTLGGDWGAGIAAPSVPAPLSSIPAAPSVAPVVTVSSPEGPTVNDRLQLQIRGLLLQLGEAEQKIATQEQELSLLRERVAELGATMRKKEAEVAQLRRESQR